MKRELIILGSTGSIGIQALDIVAANPDRFEVIALTSAGSNPELLVEQANKLINTASDIVKAIVLESFGHFSLGSL